MKSIVPLLATIGVIVVIHAEPERVNNTCEEFCCMQKKLAQTSNRNLTRALECCCSKAKSAEKRREYFLNISVDWKEERFWRSVLDREPTKKWNVTHWKFFLKMASQKCLNDTTVLTPSLVVKFKYPVFIKRGNNEKLVYRFYAPAAYLVMRKGEHDLFTSVAESVDHLWLTVCICVTWTLISGVIIWLLVSISRYFSITLFRSEKRTFLASHSKREDKMDIDVL